MKDGPKSPKPIPTDTRALIAVMRCGDRCRRFFTGLLKPWGVTLQQYNVLRILRGAGPEGLPTLELGRRMLEQTPGVTRLVDRLEKRGWVERIRDRRDRRCVRCRVSAAGLELLADLDELIRAWDRECFQALGNGEKEELISLLDRVLEEG